MPEVIVLGAGIIGVSTALHLRRRGHDVLLIDRKAPGRETSYGNAGIIQAEGIRPRAFPRSVADLWSTAIGARLDTRYEVGALPGLMDPFVRYWRNSAPDRYERIVREYTPLIRRAVTDHAELIEEAGAQKLIRKDGWMLIFRTEAARDRAFRLADEKYAPVGVGYRKLDAAGLARAEPDMRRSLAGALHWTDPWTVTDPGGLVSAYAALFERLGGQIEASEITGLDRQGAGWRIRHEGGERTAADVVVALGPWSGQLIAPLGLRLPLFAKRGYHMHYGMEPGTALRNWLLDIEVGYLISPMQRGARLTTGAEFARPGAAPHPRQIDGTEAMARSILPLAERRDPDPWLGTRPCTPDMKPIIGPAPARKGLWLAFGHAHHGFTLGPTTGKLLAEAISGEKTSEDLAAFLPDRFL
ncbi:MAG: NAD(P)/FAD-dependent oxidoreductase [Devosia sp.]